MTSVSYVFMVLFTVFWSGIVLTFDGMFAVTTWKQYQSNHFQTVTGTITRSEVKTGRTSKGGTTYSPVLAYRYEVGSKNFTGTRIRFGGRVSGKSYANEMVNSHPVDSHVTVYYNPDDPSVALLEPGLQGGDLLMPIFLTPFNAIMIAFWAGIGGWLRERIFRPVAGGVKLINDGTAIRVRLPQFAPIAWGVGVAAGLAFISIFVVGIATNMQPSMPVAVGTIVVIYGAAIGVWFWKWQIVCTGVDDLVVDKFNRKLILPETYGRKALITVAVPDIQSIWVEKVIHYSRKGGTSYTYAPTLCMPKSETSIQKLADWSDEQKARDFAEWLSKQIGVPVEGAEPARRSIETTPQPQSPSGS